MPLGDRNLVLVGMMGSGKSAVGRELSCHLGRPLVDTDTEIEKIAGMTIADIFRTSGEREFRRLESLIVRKVASGCRQVISTGGGAILDPDNRQALGEKGILVWLKASPEEICRRLAATTDRPLLSGEDRLTRVARLLSERQALYSLADLHIDTDGLKPEAVAAVILGQLPTHPVDRFRPGQSEGEAEKLDKNCEC